MFTFGFYNSYNGDRRYDAAQLSSIFDGIIDDGIFANVGEQFMTVPSSGMQVIVKTGRAWFKHTWNLNDTWMTLTVDAADPIRSRIDSVVLEVNSDVLTRENTIKIVKGPYGGSSPTPPVMQHSDGIDQYRLADITVKATVTTITEADISIKVGTDETPFVIAPLKTVDISDLFNQWNGQFQEWFANVKAQLEGDIVTNLQRQIDERVKVEDKASTDDIKNSIEGKWVDAASLKRYEDHDAYKIGDIRVSGNDLEVETGSEFVLMDGRAIDFGSPENVPVGLQKCALPAVTKISNSLLPFNSVTGIIGCIGTRVYFYYNTTSSYVCYYDYSDDTTKYITLTNIPMYLQYTLACVFNGGIVILGHDSNVDGTIEPLYIDADLNTVTYSTYSKTNAFSSYTFKTISVNKKYIVLEFASRTSAITRYLYTTDGKNWTISSGSGVYSEQSNRTPITNRKYTGYRHYDDDGTYIYRWNSNNLIVVNFMTAAIVATITMPFTTSIQETALGENVIVLEDGIIFHLALTTGETYSKYTYTPYFITLNDDRTDISNTVVGESVNIYAKENTQNLITLSLCCIEKVDNVYKIVYDMYTVSDRNHLLIIEYDVASSSCSSRVITSLWHPYRNTTTSGYTNQNIALQINNIYNGKTNGKSLDILLSDSHVLDTYPVAYNIEHATKVYSGGETYMPMDVRIEFACYFDDKIITKNANAYTSGNATITNFSRRFTTLDLNTRVLAPTSTVNYMKVRDGT